ncbi:MAG: tRNA (adenosine(37)-N6)-threonylcarbamoyltransferase complex dimerization subunit type 1 TsaB [Firmicutes bacterium]|nr:tRNA (adenosine(37)-N6)-threonylcarbamoyltransferase complex dimerization subunit type 1 TsaB [Bacillota bacterium]
MKVLAIDTSSIVATCAILDDDKLIGEYILNHKRTHSEKIMPIIKELLESCELEVKDIDCFAASIGPGSFTGLRIGVSTIKALAHATEKKVLSVPTIDALAYNIAFHNGLIVPMMDARRDRVYTGIYRWANGDLKIIRDQDVLEVDKLIDILSEYNECIVFNGDGTKVYKEKIEKRLKNIKFAPRSVNITRASSVAELAMEKLKNGEEESYFKLIPEYMKKSQAERQLEKKMESEKSNG